MTSGSIANATYLLSYHVDCCCLQERTEVSLSVSKTEVTRCLSNQYINMLIAFQKSETLTMMTDLLIINSFFITGIVLGEADSHFGQVAACYMQTARNQLKAKELEATQNKLAVSSYWYCCSSKINYFVLKVIEVISVCSEKCSKCLKLKGWCKFCTNLANSASQNKVYNYFIPVLNPLTKYKRSKAATMITFV